MKNIIIALSIIVLVLTFFPGCTEPDSDSSYLVVAEYNIDVDFQTAEVVVFEGLLTPVDNAEVRINGVLIPLFFFGIYGDTDFLPLDLIPGNTVTISVTVEGNEIMNESVIVPETPGIVSPADEDPAVSVNSNSSLAVEWTGTTVDEYRVSMGYPDTFSEEGYTAYVSGTGGPAFNSTIPAYTMDPDEIFTEIYVSSTNITSASGENLMFVSQLVSSNTSYVTVDSN